jgi:hypothetical protein
MPEGQWLESPSSGPLFAEFSIREFIVKERDHQPVLSEIALPEGWMAGCVFEISQCDNVLHFFIYSAAAIYHNRWIYHNSCVLKPRIQKLAQRIHSDHSQR